VPLKVITFEAQVAVIPAGSPVGKPIPVARVVVWVMLVNGVLTQSVGVEEATETVFKESTVMIPIAIGFPVPQSPVKGIL
jgi:hypothetical protein